ncbi:GH36-type glycosyl hydrolase domain-containing protein [Salinicola halophilus]|uniref:GH36-type glycosyl hydrolase domain-containing protein n=1 Tax=Salinicola halophilus TaxID=184065 RepID=UPI0019550A4E|nr:glucoamylase family protein [Salinicola halophilus]
MSLWGRFGRPPAAGRPFWDTTLPVREELFGPERLEQHAESLAKAQPITPRPPRVEPLNQRLADNIKALGTIYHRLSVDAAHRRDTVPAAEWLLDHYHHVEKHAGDIRRDLPPGYYRQLPKLADGPFTGYPRVFGLTWAFVAHTDSRFDAATLIRFLDAYQRVQPLTIGELWAVAISLRLVLVENVRRLGEQIVEARDARNAADALCERLLEPDADSGRILAETDPEPLGSAADHFFAQLAKRLRDQDPGRSPALAWLERQMARRETSSTVVVQRALQRQGASNVSVRNAITSLRHIADFDWATLVERVSLVDRCLRERSRFGEMDFATRDRYRNAIEQLARGTEHDELTIAQRALDAATVPPPPPTPPAQATRLADPGYYLIADGRADFERELGFRAPPTLRLRRLVLEMGLAGYAGACWLLTFALLGLAYWGLEATGLESTWAWVWLALMVLPANDIAMSLVNRMLGMGVGGEALPGLALGRGVPASLRTLVAVPAMLGDAEELHELAERLEVHYLSGKKGDVTFALLLDDVDAASETRPDDAERLRIARDAVAALNRRHGPGPTGQRFVLLYRRRQFNASEGHFMAWERKRGKLAELNRLLRGATDTSFVAIDGETPWVPADVRYVVTLDSDTRLPRDTVARLVGKMAHPLSQPVLDTDGRVTHGYAILQPRVTPSLPIGRQGSRYQRLFSAPGGLDVYSAAVSDLYQDLFGEGSFAGKGIYAVDAFEMALAGRVPENSLLSHDLLEGIFARAGLASDVEVVEAEPERYDVAARRQHRWARGDWQLLPWLVGRNADRRALGAVGCWKVADNLRRTLLAPSLFAAFAVCAAFQAPVAGVAILLTLAALIIPALLPISFALKPRHRDGDWRHHRRTVFRDLKLETGRCLLSVALLANQTWQMLDAIGRTLYRVYVSRRHLLEWTTAAALAKDRELSAASFARSMAGGALLALIVVLILALFETPGWPLLLPLLAAWLAAPLIALWTSRAPADTTDNLKLDTAQARALRDIARRTWQFFETFVTPASRALPPDNFQLDPKPVIAERTSPTNIGLYLLACVAARDFAWIGTRGAVERLEATFATLDSLERCRGHLYNWYDTATGAPLEPRYVSAVDSGNLAGHLIALANACEAWIKAPRVPDYREGLIDTLHLLHEDAGRDDSLTPTTRTALLAEIKALIERLEPGIEDQAQRNDAAADVRRCLTAWRERLADDASREAQQAADARHAANDDAGGVKLAAEASADDADDATRRAPVSYWLERLEQCLDEHLADEHLADEHSADEHLADEHSADEHSADVNVAADPAERASLATRLRALAERARTLTREMDFAFMLVPERKLMAIGYTPREDRLDDGCYDLLASEARLASLVGIAKGDLPTRHWFRLGRAVSPQRDGVALMSWSGSMFEYLMPSLVMRAPRDSLLEQTNRLVVACQQRYAGDKGEPWGISESAYNARDLDFNYQYSNFGVPSLGLKRGLADNFVLAPYATALAAMVAPKAALENFARLRELGAEGRYGFFDAIDFTPTRLPLDRDFVVVRNVMAHHQGMTIVAIANALLDGRLRTHFHAEPMIQASELLLHERLPREVATLPSPNDAEPVVVPEPADPEAAVRSLNGSPPAQPLTHLLSNGRYSVMLTADGTGFSRWGTLAITRWREDPTNTDWGSTISLYHRESGQRWAAGGRRLTTPDEVDDAAYSVEFAEDHARFVRDDAAFTTALDVLVSGEEDGEVRRVTVTNNTDRPATIELTSYAELVLTTPPADDAHPAFAKMFVETDTIDEYQALTATRRHRDPSETPIWVAHFALIDGATELVDDRDTHNGVTSSVPASSEAVSTSRDFQFETDRARFLGRGRTLENAVALMPNSSSPSMPALSRRVGAVLDPVFALRYVVRIAPNHAAHVDFWTVAADSRDNLLALIDRHHDAGAFERARTLAWTQAQVQLRHLDITLDEAADFQRLAAPILYHDARFRVGEETLARGLSVQSDLWPMGISGDLPLVVLRIADTEEIGWVNTLLRAQEYWRAKGLGVDLVILNERSHSYLQELQDAIDTAVRTNLSPPQPSSQPPQGSVIALRAHQLSPAALALVLSVARVVLKAHKGPLHRQLTALLDVDGESLMETRRDARPLAPLDRKGRRTPESKTGGKNDGKAGSKKSLKAGIRIGARTDSPTRPAASSPESVKGGSRESRESLKARTQAAVRLDTTSADARAEPGIAGDPARPEPSTAVDRPPVEDLEFFNGLGGFARDGREYVCVLDDGATTPQPWINVIANAGFGFQVSAEGSGYVWADNSRDNQLTPWSNDPVSDPAGEVIYVQDADTGVITTATAAPCRSPGERGRYVARHGFGYSRFDHDTATLSLSLLQFVPKDDPIKISRLTLTNRSDAPQTLIVTHYANWVMGNSRAKNALYLTPTHDADTGALLMRNPWNMAFPNRVGFVDLGGRAAQWTADRREFLGAGSLAAPEALTQRRALSGWTGLGRDPATVLQCTLTLAPNESVTLDAFLGQTSDAETARTLILRYREADLADELDSIERYWRELHASLQVRTPDRAMDVMLNGWLTYQTLACRVTARSAFYQASGAYGFRDQLQDGMALTFALPDLTRHHLLRAAGRQFVEGDVQHWWLPHSGQGVRTRIADDRVWLAFAAATYVQAADDEAVLDEPVGFLEAPTLAAGAHDEFSQPSPADETAPLFEHCVRALEQALEQFGEHGLPLIGTGDWNDGFNRVGEAGQGESVWLGWMLLRTLTLFDPLITRRDPARADRWRERAEALREALETHAWDGDWYRRATFDNGDWMGTKASVECRIDAIAQSWAVLSERADPERAARAMDSVAEHLIREDDGLALLFTPPFDKSEQEPGYIKGYPPGLRENGGQYTHAATWTILALAKLGQAERAHALFAMVNPVNHALTPEAVERYRVEPYVIAADVYSEPPHVGHGGWTWYTGSGGWFYQAGARGILGIRREGRELIVAPAIPDDWPGYAATVELEGGRVEIRIERAEAGETPSATLDGEAIGSDDGARVPLDGQAHALVMRLESKEGMA